MSMQQKKSIDLNCDMGELKPNQLRNYDVDIMPYISSCNVACGFHSGNPLLIEQTIRAALAHGVQIGAHPSYNDRANFGRQSVVVERATLLSELRYQISAVKGMVESLGGKLNHIKPHGALYNDMLKDTALATDVLALVQSIDPDLKLMTLAHSKVVEQCEQLGMQVIQEGFADRRYEAIDQLWSRQFSDAVIHAPHQVLEQVAAFLKGEVRLVDQQVVTLNIDSLCLHSDTQGAVELSKIIHQFLKENHVRIAAIV